MKEYALFVKPDGDAEMFCGGQFSRGANCGDVATSIAALWKELEKAGERLMEIRDTGDADRKGERTFIVRTVPVVRAEPEPENCYEGRCGHPKNFAGSCVVYLMSHPPQRACRD